MFFLMFSFRFYLIFNLQCYLMFYVKFYLICNLSFSWFFYTTTNKLYKYKNKITIIPIHRIKFWYFSKLINYTMFNIYQEVFLSMIYSINKKYSDNSRIIPNLSNFHKEGNMLHINFLLIRILFGILCIQIWIYIFSIVVNNQYKIY